MRFASIARVCAVALGLGSAAPLLAQAPNDNCSTPTAITGSGNFTFNFGQAANDIPFVGGCEGAGIDLSRDLWYCWTANCTGLVTITTCGLTSVDTAIAIYDGCACPAVPSVPRCCNDNSPIPGCAPQSTVTCQVECGHQYMIQLGERDFSGGPGGSGQFSIGCEGQPCGGGDPCPAGECCGGTPRFVGTAGPVAAVTVLNLAPGGTQLQVIDLLNSNSAPAGSNWNAAPFLTPHASWSRQNLGTVFGVAIDGQGNIYTAHSSSYGTNFLGMPIVDAVGSGGPGAIYKISTATAVATSYLALPNTLDPVIAAQPGYANEAWPGLGNISIDCGRNTLFATNFDDGRIYRISLTSGAVLSAYDHAGNTVSAGGAPEIGDAPGFARLGERVWAVEPHNGRVYYSIWGSDLSRNVAPNTIWSIQMDPSSGEFLPSTRQQEVLNGLQPTQNRMPTSDIAFSPGGNMMLAQRTMGDGPPAVADTLVWAHESYVLEFACDAAGGWVQGNTFATATNGFSAAGGVDVDYRTGQTYNVWATSDALVYNPPTFVYGLQGFPAAGGSVSNSALIDSDQDTSSHDKTQQGSVELSCPSPCAQVDFEHIQCIETPDDGTGIQCYDFTFTITNQTSQAIQYVLIPTAGVTPNVIGPFAAGTFDPGDTQTITVEICGPPGTSVNFPIVLMNTQFDACCNLEIIVDLPECDCLQILSGPTVVDLGGGQYSISLTYTPTEFNVSHVFFDWEPIGNPTYSVNVNPNYFPVSVPQWGTGTVSTTFTVNPNGGPNPTTICFRLFIHRFDLWTCCSVLVCVEVDAGGAPCPGDTNGDGVVDLTDLAQLLGNFGMLSGATVANGDFDFDGDVDLADLSLLLSNFGVPCN